jgi:hypothetical protein
LGMLPGSSAATSPLPTPPASTVGTRPGLIYDQGSSFQLLAVEAVDGGLGLSLGRHLDEAESSGFASKLVFQNADAGGAAECFKRLTHIIFRGVARNVAYIDIHLVTLYVCVYAR